MKMRKKLLSAVEGTPRASAGHRMAKATAECTSRAGWLLHSPKRDDERSRSRFSRPGVTSRSQESSRDDPDKKARRQLRSNPIAVGTHVRDAARGLCDGQSSAAQSTHPVVTQEVAPQHADQRVQSVRARPLCTIGPIHPVTTCDAALQGRRQCSGCTVPVSSRPIA